jgi:hypothetical protein
MNGPDRRTMVIAAAVLFGVIALGVLGTALLSDPGPPSAETPAAGQPPSIIVKPNSGAAPEDSGDRGGWEQLALLGLMVSAIGVIAVFALRGSNAKAKAGRDRWKAAAQSDADGAVG